jgi:hypothetical protein
MEKTAVPYSIIIPVIMANDALVKQIIQQADDAGLLVDYAERFPEKVHEGNVVDDLEDFLYWVAEVTE